MLLGIADRLLAGDTKRANAVLRAQNARVEHGADAPSYLQAKLADPRRRRSRRELHLALALLGPG